jgi:hypothetical protein
VLVGGDRVGEPSRTRLGADEHEYRPCLHRAGDTLDRVLDGDRLEPPVAVKRADLRTRVHLDRGHSLHLIDEVARHPGARSPPRSSRSTLLTRPARNTAACPAELAPPTTTTGAPLHNCASTSVAA